MTFQSLVALTHVILLGIFLTMIILPRPTLSNFLLKIMIGAGLGVGLDSCLYFLFSLIANPQNKLFLVLELILTILGLIFVIRNILQEGFYLQEIKNKLVSIPVFSWVLIGLFVLVMCASVTAFFYYSTRQPYGHYDAFSIWNYRARNIFLLKANWLQAFSSQQTWETHPDYPLLLPLNILRLWVFLGSLNPRAPITFAAVITFTTVGLLFSAVGFVKGWGQAAVAGLVLIGTPWLFTIGASQIADMPLAYAVLATCILYFLFLHEGHPQYLVLAGLMAGMAGWTKNEGLMFIAAFSITILMQNRKKLRQIVPFLLGLVIPLGIIILFKFTLAPPNDLFALQSFGQMGSKLISIDRYRILLPIYGKFLANFGGWRVPIFLVLLLIAIFLHEPHLTVSQRKAITAIVLCCAITFTGYTLMFLISPHPLAWHANNSAERLMFHFYPTLLFLFFISIRSIDEAVHRGTPQIG